MRGVAYSENPPALPVEPDALLGGVWRGAYRIIRRIDDGLIANAYEAIHLGLGTVVRLRLLAQSLSRGQTAVHRRELAALRALAHPHIERIIDFDSDESGTHFVASELLDGETLRARLDRGERIDVPESVELVVAIGGALVAARRAIVMHGDVDASKVVLVPGPNKTVAKLVGLGIVPESSNGDALECSEVVSVRESSSVDRADQVALAAIAFELLVGRSPFALSVAPPPLPELADGARLFAEAILRVLDPSPGGGYRSLDDFVRELSLGALAIDTTRAQSGAFVKSATTTARRRVPATQTSPDEIAHSVQLSRRALESGDIYEAAFRAERAVKMAEDSRNPLAVEVIERAFALLERVFYARLGGGSRKLYPRRASTTWTELRVSREDGVLLGLIAGGETLDDVLRKSGRPRLETLKDLAALARRGMLSIE